jgi:hypothetical protein
MRRLIGTDGANGTLAALTGLGVITIALAPFALPILILTIVALLPFAIPVIVLGIPLAIFLAIRGIYRRLSRTSARRRRHTDGGSQSRVTRGVAEGARRAARA